MNQGIVRAQFAKALVYLQPFQVTAPAGVVVAKNLQRLDVILITAEQAFHKPDFLVQVPQFLPRGLPPRSVQFFWHMNHRHLSLRRAEMSILFSTIPRAQVNFCQRRRREALKGRRIIPRFSDSKIAR